MQPTAFFHDERCLWHGGGDYVLTAPVGGLVQPGGGLPESPETKRRLVNLLHITGLMDRLALQTAPAATREDLLRVHPASYLDAFQAMSDAGGGELGLRTPFLRGGYEIAALSAGLARAALFAVLQGRAGDAYALSRPLGHHALPDFPNGFCLLNNIAIAIRAARAAGLARRFAVVDWDVHHGNGTETIFLDDPDVLTISIHQDRNYPLDTGSADIRGVAQTNVNIPLPAGAGHATYMQVMERIVSPALRRFAPDIIVIACGYDASAVDPLGRMVLGADSFDAMTASVMRDADDLCQGRLVAVHEGGYSELHVPFCGHAVISRLSGAGISAPDPLQAAILARQPSPAWNNHLSAHVSELAGFFEV
ncbi:class II histone deacetylase [Paracoccus sp. DMF-8]|uniref:class II histone deacetylase n=1 Tax=Paracoccus sp. DMF-8 TaxID=3019445 RepID=UPI0023E3D575|nr:class II histone deacetylase [Paracoccus sp. DMF-8]MDF3607426.1 class II histone deacetylase [Paracoccus sp. DMF-8]